MINNRFTRTRRMILSRVLLVPFITVMLVCGTLVYYFAVSLRQQVVEKLAGIGDDHRRMIDQFLAERAADLQLATACHDFNALGNDDAIAKLLADLQKISRAFLDLGVFDQDGNHVAYVGPYNLEGKNYSQAEWFQEARQQPVYISDVFMGYRNFPHFIIAVKSSTGGKDWYLRATIDTLFFNELVESIRVGKTGEACIVNREGVFQTPRRSGGKLMETDPDRALYPSSGGAVVSFTASDTSGNRHLYAVGRLSKTSWLLVVRQETSDAYAPLTRAVLVAVAMIVAGGAVVVFMAYILASGLANRLTVADIEKRQMGAQLIMAGKLAEVGEMSAGVAHEINNPLQVMKAEQALIMEILAEVGKDGALDHENIKMLKDSLSQIGIQIDRCKNITQGLLRFSRKSETSIKSMVVEQFTKEVVSLVAHRALMENVKIVQDYEPGLPPLISDPGQMQQVMLNLLNNAIHALKDRGDGEIRINASRDGSMLVLSVADNGCGIPPENLEKVFLPFFTTKPVGQGTGLGLSTCYGIIERLGGQISVASEVNTGSVFTIQLPLSGPPGEAGT